ncbi:hypothetical protein ACIHFC_03560 [Streptomyces sp. NPDC052013]
MTGRVEKKITDRTRAAGRTEEGEAWPQFMGPRRLDPLK